MTAYHVALSELAGEILANGLDPDGGRAIVLLPEPPAEAFGFDVWEVDCDAEFPEGDSAFCLERIPPERLALYMERASAPSMGM